MKAQSKVASAPSPGGLMKRLASIAHAISDTVQADLMLPQEHTILRDLYATCRATFAPSMSVVEYADMTAQALTCSFFAAWLDSIESLQRQQVIPFFPEDDVFSRYFCHLLSDTQQYPRLNACLDDLVSVFEETDRATFAQAFPRHAYQEDPLNAFYERFLQAYNPHLRARRGVYYTPMPVVSYLVSSIDFLLRSRFDCPRGLVGIGALQGREVRILDPTCGTGIFLQAIVERIYRDYRQQEEATENADLAYLQNKALPHLTGIEVLLAPYLIAQLRLRIYLASLQGAEARQNDGMSTGPFRLGNALDTRFSASAGTHGRDTSGPYGGSVLVVVGNPPYAGHSANKGRETASLLAAYKEDYPELKKPAQAKWLSDDYVKFLRLAQQQIDAAGQGILAFITSHSYLDNPTFRGMRRSLFRSFDELFILDLHGNSKKKELAPGGARDENIFDIQQGVAISIFVKLPSPIASQNVSERMDSMIHHAHLWGSSEEKLAWLAARDVSTTEWTTLEAQAPAYLFAPWDMDFQAEYESFWSIPDIFRPNGNPAPGIITCHDDFAIAARREELTRRVERFLDTSGEEEARQLFRLCAQSQWNYTAAKRALRDGAWREQLTPVLYRPFDTRWTVYNRHVAVHLRERVTRHMLAGPNLALAIGKAGQVIHQETWDIAFCTRSITEFNLFRRGGNNLFPLYLYKSGSREVNLAPAFVEELIGRLNLQWLPAGQGDLQSTVGPEDILYYIYAVLYSPAFRARYAAFLKRDFPRIPLPSSRSFFRSLCQLGKQLVSLHLEECEVEPHSSFPAQGSNFVERVRYRQTGAKDGQVWMNATQYFGGVPPDAWAFTIGGYQVCQKWLKDRRGHVLSDEEIGHYRRVVAILEEAVRLMGEIDATIKKQGGISFYATAAEV